ncbi:MAG: N-acetylneuraminate synthase family protein [Bacteroidota bacterium]
MKKINVNGFEIGGDKTFIIADIGSNHKQDLTLAKESIDAAAESGADAIKFQSIQLDELYLNPDPKTVDFIKQLEFPEEWHFLLKEYCDKRNILFFSSPTYLKAIDLLEEINVPLYKIASAQIGTFPQIIEKVASLHKPTIFSTGIAAYEEIIKAVNIFKKHGNDQFIILHCNSIYPTPAGKVNLQLMNTYKHMFGNPVGFSDHTDGTHIACAAVAMGAKVIEKHFTLHRKLNTPDCSSFASDPEELKKLVNTIRDIENASNVFHDRLQIQSEELEFKESIRYKIIASENIEKGEIIQNEKLNYLRSNYGIDCTDLYKIIGKKTRVGIKNGEVITLDKIIIN